MASLTLTIGQLTATVTADNTKAVTVLEAFADAIGATGTNQERANAVVRALARHMVQQGQARRGNQAQEDAMAAAQAEIDGISWE